jgi:signal transduction histidine kinase
LLLIGALLTTAGVTVLLLHAERHRGTEHLQVHGATLTRLLAQTAVHYVATGQVDALQHLVRSIRDPQLVYCAVVDTENRLIVQTDEGQRGRPFTVQAHHTLASPLELQMAARQLSSGESLWHFSMPIATATDHFGTLHLGMQVLQPGLASARSVENVALIALIIFLLVATVYYCLRALLRPLRQLNERLEAHTTGELFQPLDMTQQGEIGTLVRHWNQAMAHVQTSLEATKRANFELELTANVIDYEKRRLEMVLDRLSDAILITDSSSTVMFANRMTARLLSVPLDHLVGQTLHNCITHDGISSLLADSGDMGQHVKVKSLDITFATHPAEAFKVIVSSIIDHEEKFVGTLLLIRNVTQQKIAEQARSEFISAVSHELKNPLSIIKSYVELLINQVVDDNTTKYDFYNTINDETDRMTRLIDNLLNLSKIELGLLVIKPSRVRMRQLVSDCCQAMESRAVAKHITFETHLSEKLSALEVDKDLLSVVLMNLLSNALKYTPAGGEVIVLAEETDADMQIHVRDSGIGITEADLTRIFERFYRGGNTGETSGSGLGLALAQQIAHLHGGSITVTSQAQQGSQFTLTLPKPQRVSQLVGTGKGTHENSDH